jgi:hypothetical protein
MAISVIEYQQDKLMFEETLQAALRSADDQGRVTFRTTQQPYIRQTGSKAAFLQEHVQSHLFSFETLHVQVENPTSFNKTVGLVATPLEDAGQFQISFDLALAFRLPGQNSKAELEEFAAFLDGLKPFFEAHATARPRIKVLNVRDRNRKTFGEILCQHRSEAGGKPFQDESFTRKVMTLVEASVVLSSWLRQQALDLNRQGPHSWLFIMAEHLFEKDENPVRGATKAALAFE